MSLTLGRSFFSVHPLNDACRQIGGSRAADVRRDRPAIRLTESPAFAGHRSVVAAADDSIGAPSGEGPILDLCTGTADLALAYWRAVRGTAPVGWGRLLPPMLVIARGESPAERSGRVGFPRRSRRPTTPLPRRDIPDRLSVAFGLAEHRRHDRGLREMVRVCRSAAVWPCWRFSYATNLALPHILRVVLPPVLPRVGQALAGNRQSVLQLPSGERRRVSAGRTPSAACKRQVSARFAITLSRSELPHST